MKTVETLAVGLLRRPTRRHRFDLATWRCDRCGKHALEIVDSQSECTDR